MKRSFAQIMQDLDDGRARKLARKLPEWASVDAERRSAGLDPLEFPSALSLEQCSSEATARYKAAVAAERDMSGDSRPRSGAEAGGGKTIVDITGGLGVDSRAFSQVAERVVYFERNAELAAAAERNFRRLGATGIEVRCETVGPDTDLPEADLIYADPARRDAAGRKVFLLEDCSPDILPMLPMLLRKAPAVLLKLSPMADLAMLARRLGPFLHEIRVVELDGEVKELLCLLLREPAPAEPEILAVRLSGGASGGQGIPVFRFRQQEEREAELIFAESVRTGELLLDPSPALLKAGAFRLPCARWGLQKLAVSTHLYLSPVPSGTKTASNVPGTPFPGSPGTETGPAVPGGGLPADAAPWFKAYRVLEVLPLGSAAFRQLRQRYPRAEITARNLPLGSDALRRKLGISPGGEVHIFGCRLTDGSAVLIVCGQIN